MSTQELATAPRERWRCTFCGGAFSPGSNVQRYCSKDCSKAHRRERDRARKETVVCACGVSYTRQVRPSPPPVKCSTCRAVAASVAAGNDGLFFDRPRWFISCRDGSRVAYYRAVMEAELRRPLGSDEHVHHINGDPADDRIENLQLVTAATHSRIHVHELLERRASKTHEERSEAARKAWKTKRAKAG